uniref:Uncharacterized protein n=1 Tax=Meloidogyne incognita TaxID=6306 RepID=A0A914ME22_MELIC
MVCAKMLHTRTSNSHTFSQCINSTMRLSFCCLKKFISEGDQCTHQYFHIIRTIACQSFVQIERPGIIPSAK